MGRGRTYTVGVWSRAGDHNNFYGIISGSPRATCEVLDDVVVNTLQYNGIVSQDLTNCHGNERGCCRVRITEMYCLYVVVWRINIEM